MNSDEAQCGDGIPADEAGVVRWLAELGVARQLDAQSGGVLWADFGDWCWVQSVPRSHEALEVFLATRVRQPDARALRRALELLGPRSQGERS